MKKIDKPKNTLVRKKKVTIDCLSEEQKYNLLKDYKTGSFTLNQLIEKYNLSSYDRLLDFINEFIAGLNIIKETNSINSKTNSFYSSYKPNNLINEPFFSLLSPPTDSLTDEEMTYCYLYVFTGDNTGAIEQSGLDAGLTYKRILKDTPTYAYAMKVR